MKKFLLALIIFIPLIGFACLKENRKLGKFTAIDLKNSANVFITEGDVQEIIIEAENPQNISTVIKDNKLIIDSKAEEKESATIFITVKNLCHIENAGSGNITTTNRLNCQMMSLKISGTGDMNANLNAKSIKMTNSGSGDIKTQGIAQEAEVNITGTGNIDGKDLQTTSTSVNITGSGTSTVDVNDNLTVNIKGNGNVFYLSSPERIYSVINGRGKIEKVSS